jgi:hypothetical protein
MLIFISDGILLLYSLLMLRQYRQHRTRTTKRFILIIRVDKWKFSLTLQENTVSSCNHFKHSLPVLYYIEIDYS